MAVSIRSLVMASALLAGVMSCTKEAKMLTADVTSLVQAERSFAATARAKGIGPGFMSVLDANGVVFQPGPVNGPDTYRDLESSPAILAWQPVYAEIASSGDLGYTTGPWEYFLDSANPDPVAFGEYISVWRWQPENGWRLALDIGTFRSRLEVDTTLSVRTLTAAGNTAVVTTNDLLTRDRALAARAGSSERQAVYAEALADDARVMRSGGGPLVGKENVLAWMDRDSLVEATFPEAAFISSAGDLGYVYGRAEVTIGAADTSGAIAHGGYARLWRRVGDRWKLALDVLSVRPGDLAALTPADSN